ncbi:MAG: ABC transporter ATP-binding protein [Candidatus Andersenbacteria bacterium]|nr:ABC transporter ATP-binding protein [Candidatus Andersenbacteria bacterium]
MNSVRARTVQLARFLAGVGVPWWHFTIPVVLTALAAAFEGISLSLLIPLARGVVAQNFTLVNEVPVLARAVALLPQLAQRPVLNTSGWLVAIIFLTAWLKIVFKYLSGLSVASISRRAVHTLRQIVFDRYLRFGKLYFDQSSIGYLNQVLMTYTFKVTEPISQAHLLLSTVCQLAVYLASMFSVSWQLTLFVLVVVPPLNYSLKWLLVRIRAASRTIADSLNEFSKQTFNILSSVPLVKSYTNEAVERQRFGYLSGEAARLEYGMARARQLILPLQESITLFTVLLVVASMAWLIARGHAAASASFLIYFYVLMNAANTYGSINRYRGVLAEVSGPLQEIRAMLSNEGKFIIPDGRRYFNGLRDAIVFDRLSFSYPGGRAALREVAFEVERGRVTALVGPTGAGKSTLVNLIMRFYDCAPGHLFIDGVDIREYTVRSLRQHVALVSQQAELFNDTIRNNIVYGLTRVPDDDLVAVLNRARLSEFVSQLPQGLKTAIGDRGVQLSGGERQRVAIARALLKGADILLLDEATSALDSKTERLIQEALDEVMRDKTALVIAHRLSTIKHADKIVVLDAGTVVEQGSFADLLSARGVFYELWQAQQFF